MIKVLFDHNMPPSIARAMPELISNDGHEAHALRDRFETNISDIDFFTMLGRESNWVVISRDTANAKRPPERQAIIRSGVLAFYLAKFVRKQRITEQAATILWRWDKIVVQRQTNANGLFELPIGKRTKFKTI